MKIVVFQNTYVSGTQYLVDVTFGKSLAAGFGIQPYGKFRMRYYYNNATNDWNADALFT
jgi:hypothetical protein